MPVATCVHLQWDPSTQKHLALALLHASPALSSRWQPMALLTLSDKSFAAMRDGSRDGSRDGTCLRASAWGDRSARESVTRDVAQPSEQFVWVGIFEPA